MQERLDRAPGSMRIRRQTAKLHSEPSTRGWARPTSGCLPRKGQRGDEPSRSRLQSEADDRHPRGAAANPADEGGLSLSSYEKLNRQQTDRASWPLPHRLSKSPFRTASAESANTAGRLGRMQSAGKLRFHREREISLTAFPRNIPRTALDVKAVMLRAEKIHRISHELRDV